MACMYGNMDSGDFAGLRESSKMKLTPRRKSARLDGTPPLEAPVQKITRYRECCKNYAASSGGHALDGCQEFIACGEEGTLEALTCGTCNCHRNFHRKEVEGCNCQTLGAEPHPPLASTTVTSNGPTDSDDQEGGTSASDTATKKRIRTNFSAEQKEKMFSFVEKLGWKIQKHDERAVESFCAEIGVKPLAFKNWMKNNRGH